MQIAQLSVIPIAAVSHRPSNCDEYVQPNIADQLSLSAEKHGSSCRLVPKRGLMV